MFKTSPEYLFIFRLMRTRGATMTVTCCPLWRLAVWPINIIFLTSVYLSMNAKKSTSGLEKSKTSVLWWVFTQYRMCAVNLINTVIECMFTQAVIQAVLFELCLHGRILAQSRLVIIGRHVWTGQWLYKCQWTGDIWIASPLNPHFCLSYSAYLTLSKQPYLSIKCS